MVTQTQTPTLTPMRDAQRMIALLKAEELGADRDHLMFALSLLRKLWAQEMTHGACENCEMRP